MRLCTLVFLLVLIPLANSQTAQYVQRLPAGTWGGQSLHVDLTTEGATLEFDCARGTILEPIVVDSHGNFHVHGTYKMEGGPVRRDDQSAGAAVEYTGSVHGATMLIQFVLPGSEQPSGPFTLTRGDSGRLRKCK